MSQKIPFLWTNDDITRGKRESLERILAFLDPFGIKGTFFVIPVNGGSHPITDDALLIQALKKAMADGHEAHQHSTTHQCAENGIADLRMYDLMGMDAKQYLSDYRFTLERLWELDAIRRQIAWGRRVWIEAFGSPSEGFRPGCGAFCRNLYRAAHSLGFKWTSSRLVSLTGWQRVFGNEMYPLTWEGPVLPSMIEDIMEMPILDDVAFRVPTAKIDQFIELGWAHWQQCVAKGWPFHLVSHPFALEFENGTGYRIHQALLRRILDTGQADPMTVGQYYHAVKAGKYPMADPSTAYAGRDAIPEWHILHPSHAAELAKLETE